MPATFGAEIGGAVDATGVTSKAFTTTASVPAGALIVIFAANEAGGATNLLVSSITDSASNTYVQAVDQGEASGPSNGAIWYASNVAALANSSTITVTWTAATTSVAISGAYATSIATATPLDQTKKATGNSTAPSTGASATLAQADEILFGLVMINGSNATTLTGIGSWTALTSRGSGTSTTDTTIFPAYQVVSATTGVTYSGTLSAALIWNAVEGSFKGAASTAKPSPVVVTQAVRRASYW